MKKHDIASGLSTLALAALAAGCTTSRTSIFGSSSGAGSPRDAQAKSAVIRQATPLSQLRTPHGATIPAGQTVRQTPAYTSNSTSRFVPPPHPAPAAHSAPVAPIIHPAQVVHPATPAPAPRPAPEASGWRIYEIQPGDTATALANANGMYTKEFCEVNGIEDPNKIRAGQKVKLATGRKPLGSGPAHRVAANEPAPDGASRHASASTHAATTHRAVASNRPTARDPETAPPPRTEKTGTATTDINALLNGGSLTSQRTVAEEQARLAAEAEKVRAEAARREAEAAKARAEAEAAKARAEAEAEARRLAEKARADAEAAKARANDAAANAVSTAQNAVKSNPVAAAAPGTHVVEVGEDIYSISLKYDTTPLELRRINGGKSLTGLQPGDVIAIPTGSAD